MARQRLGRAAEAFVADALERRGMRIVARNERTSAVRGEIDLVAVDGAALVFVEVKARRAGSVAGPERPAMAVGAAQAREAAPRSRAAWLRDRGYDVPRHRELRFDVVGCASTPAGARWSTSTSRRVLTAVPFRPSSSWLVGDRWNERR